MVAVALANKTARIAWAVMHRHEKWCVSGRKRQFSGAQVTPQVTRNRPEMTPRCGTRAFGPRHPSKIVASVAPLMMTAASQDMMFPCGRVNLGYGDANKRPAISGAHHHYKTARLTYDPPEDRRTRRFPRSSPSERDEIG